MGVQNLNKIIHSCNTSAETIFKRIIIDGSNLLLHQLKHFTAQLKQLYPITVWNAYDKNIIFQTNFLITNTVADIFRTILALKHRFQAEEIYIVFDPPGVSEYYVSGDMIDIGNTYQKLSKNKYISRFLSDEEIANNITIEFNIKKDEQDARKRAADKKDFITNTTLSIDSLKLSDSDKEVMKDIFKQAYFYNETSELVKLFEIIIEQISHEINNYKQTDLSFNVYLVKAHLEADLVIKNIAIRHKNNDRKTLVLSMDTDYYVLFSDSPNVYVTDLYYDKIYNPYECWNEFLGDAYSYNVVIRLAPLLGNDYTAKAYVISPDSNKDDILALLNIYDFNDLRKSKRKKIYKFIGNYTPKEEEITDINILDDMVFKYDDIYFNKYYLSIITYKNWKYYNEFEIINEDENRPCLTNELLTNIYKRLFDKFDNIYEWDSYNELIDDNNKLVNYSIIQKPIDSELITFWDITTSNNNTTNEYNSDEDNFTENSNYTEGD